MGLLTGESLALALAFLYSGNTNVRYDTVFSLGPFNINKNNFVTPFGVGGRGKASLEIVCIVHFVLNETQRITWQCVVLGSFNINK